MTRLEVPDDMKAMLMRPFLSKKGRLLVSRMDPQVSENYQEMKIALLRELKLTSKEYLDTFHSISKQEEETYVLWINKLFAIMQAYLESRDVKGFEDLVSLLISDRAKASIEGTAVGRHIQAIEATRTEDKWLRHRDLAVAIDQFLAGRPSQKERSREKRIDKNDDEKWKSGSKWKKMRKFKQRNYDSSSRTEEQGASESSVSKSDDKTDRKSGACWKCGKTGCKSFYHNDDGSIKAEFKDRLKTVSRVAIESTERKPVRLEMSEVSKNGQDEEIQELMKVNANDKASHDDSECELFQSEPLEFIDIMVSTERSGKGHKARALKDSGAEIALVHSRVLRARGLNVATQGLVQIRGVVGPPMQARLGWLYARFPTGQHTVPVLCAISNCFHEDFVIPTTVVMRLTDQANKDSDLTVDNVTKASFDNDGLKSINTVDMDKPEDRRESFGGEDHNRQATAIQLRDEQQNDTSLCDWRRLADLGKAGLFYRDGLLFRKDQVAGNHVNQLCLPLDKCRQAFQLAHSTTHLGADKCYQTMRLTFAWPGMK